MCGVADQKLSRAWEKRNLKLPTPTGVAQGAWFIGCHHFLSLASVPLPSTIINDTVVT
jgi:hypothetical protein